MKIQSRNMHSKDNIYSNGTRSNDTRCGTMLFARIAARPLAVLAISALGLLGTVQTAPAAGSARDRAAIVSAVKTYIKRTSPAIGAVTVTKIDIQGSWAIATAIPDSRNMENADVLCRKQKSRWKVLVLGSDLHGTGRQYGVPKHLWRKWGL